MKSSTAASVTSGSSVAGTQVRAPPRPQVKTGMSTFLLAFAVGESACHRWPKSCSFSEPFRSAGKSCRCSWQKSCGRGSQTLSLPWWRRRDEGVDDEEGLHEQGLLPSIYQQLQTSLLQLPLSLGAAAGQSATAAFDATILKTNSTFNSNSYRGPEVTAMRSSPCACQRERRGEGIIQPVSCSRSPFCSVQFLKLPQD